MKATLLKTGLMAVLLCMFAVGRSQTYVQHGLNQPPALGADAGPDQLVCPNDPANLGGSPTASNGYGAYTYLWSPATGLSSPTVSNPVATLAASETYELLVIDSLGCQKVDTVVVTVDTCTGLRPVQALASMDVYPNPSHGFVTVTIVFEQQLEAATLRVVDLQGRTVLQKVLRDPAMELREQLALGHLSKGSYYIRLEADGKEVSKKIILQ